MALLIVAAVSAVLRLLLAILVSRLGALARRTANFLDDAVIGALRGTRFAALVAVGVAVAHPLVHLSPGAAGILRRVLALVFIGQVGLWVTSFAVGWLQSYRKQKLEADRGVATSVGALIFLARLAIGSVTLLIALDNVGVDVTALITGLGIGGVAVALAIQNVLGDLFASLSIVLDRPFVIGDFLVVGDYLGAVENVGLKTTRLRSLSGEQLVFSNSDLLGSRIRNYGRMAERRIVFSLGVTYDTPLEKLRNIPGIIRETITEQERTRFDRSHFAKYGAFSLDFETAYYVLVPDYNVYMDIQQAINLRLRERFDAEGIEFAYPTQTLILQKGP